MCRCQALHGGLDALALAAVMQNIHTYYKQFQHMVQEDLQKGLAPIEKHLKVCLPYLGTTSKVRLASMWIHLLSKM